MITMSIHILPCLCFFSVRLFTARPFIEVEKHAAVRCQQGAHFSCHYEAHCKIVMMNLRRSDILYQFPSSHPQLLTDWTQTHWNSSDTGSAFCHLNNWCSINLCRRIKNFQFGIFSSRTKFNLLLNFDLKYHYTLHDFACVH